MPGSRGVLCSQAQLLDSGATKFGQNDFNEQDPKQEQAGTFDKQLFDHVKAFPHLDHLLLGICEQPINITDS